MSERNPRDRKPFKAASGNWGVITHFALFDTHTESAIMVEGEVLFPLSKGKVKVPHLK